MCLAIFKPGNVVVPAESIVNGWQHNPDGAGFAYVHKRRVQMVKGLMNLKEFQTAYNTASKKYRNSPFLIHFRIRSMGDKTPDNTHPFPIPGGALIHNGTIDGTGANYGIGESDTLKFARMFGDRLTYATLSEHKAEFETILGYNRVVLLYHNAKHVILGEVDGEWDEGVWYSNLGYKPRNIAAPGPWMGGMYD